MPVKGKIDTFSGRQKAVFYGFHDLACNPRRKMLDTRFMPAVDLPMVPVFSRQTVKFYRRRSKTNLDMVAIAY
jgi:hypothetical protein